MDSQSDGIRVLVVDDEPGMREGCRRILIAEGYAVETAEDGMAGLELFQQQRNFAAALVDLKMPRLSGVELVEALRALDSDVLLLVITAYATIETAVEATKRGAYGYIPKPFTPEELLMPLRHGLERRQLAIETRQLREERERRLLEVAFERSKAKTIINCMTDGVLVTNREKQVVLRNVVAARLLPALANSPLPVSLGAVGLPALTDLLVSAIQPGSTPSIASREITIGESTFMVNVSPVTEGAGEMQGAVAVLRDITALKKLEVAKSMFVSLVAHEVKRPLAAIESNLKVVLGGYTRDPDKQRHMIERALERSKGLLTLVTELRSLSTMEAGRYALNRVPMDLVPLAADAVESAKEKAAEKQMTLSFENKVAGTVPRVMADAEAMKSVFGNLLDNAVKYTPDGRRAGLRVARDGLFLRFTVWDEGIGMSAEELSHVFEEFYRAQNEFTSRVPGTGLGLSLAKRLVEIHQGEVTIDSTPGKGSCFAVSLPIVE
jgi:two-component system, OmpR family, phosphate regulon sensor histidine kinase PhoR